MSRATYKIISADGQWTIAHDGTTLGSYATKEAAFEAAILPASHAIKQGLEVTISVEGGSSTEPALGAP